MKPIYEATVGLSINSHSHWAVLWGMTALCPHADNHHIGANHTKHTHGTHFSGCLKKTDNYVKTLAQLPVFTQPKLSLWPNWESQRISQFFFSYICEFFSQNTTQPKTELEQQVWIVPELDFSFNKPSVLYSTLLHTSPRWHQESLLLITCRGSIKKKKLYLYML